jgi:hypothetical protein
MRKIILKLTLEKKEWVSVDWTDLAHDRVKWRAPVETVKNIGFHRRWRHF